MKKNITGSNPMSSIRSASSRTKNFTCDRLTCREETDSEREIGIVLVQTDDSFVDEMQQASGSSDDNVAAVVHFPLLVVHFHSSVDDSR